jgi:protein TonB
MFEALLESSPVKRKTRNPWAYFISLVVQTFFVGLLILIPLLYTEALPKQDMMLSWLAAPPPPPPPPPPPAAQPIRRAIKRVSQLDQGKLRAPREIPREIAIIKEDPIEEDTGGVVGGVPGGVPGGQMGGVLGGVLGGIPSAAPPPKPVAPQRIRISSGVQAAKKIHDVQPIYPPVARTARISGTVRLEAIIAKDGTIQNLRVVGQAHPLLIQAALQAVQQWRYEPTLLSGEPVEVETIIDVVFRPF